MRYEYINKNTGFTLIESLVAVSIMLIVVVAPLSIVAQELIAARISRENLVATYLAQEGIEIVRAIRDTNQIRGAFWLNGLVDFCNAAEDEDKRCYIDPRTIGSVQECPADVCPQISFHGGTGFYGYNDEVEDDTEFRRDIHYVPLGADEIVLYSTVFWGGIAGEKSVTIEDHLHNWQQ